VKAGRSGASRPSAASARASLHNQVLRLRRVLGDAAVRRTPDGYRLDTTVCRTDLLEFEDLAADGDAALRERRWKAAAETLAAALSDIYDRVSRGAPATEFWKNVMGSIRQWALASSDSAHMHELASAVDKLYGFAKDDRNKPYYRVIWLKTDKELGLRWQTQGAIDQDPKYIEELATWLEEHAKNPGVGGLNFKDDKKK